MIFDRILLGTSSALGFFFLLSLLLYWLIPGSLTRTVLQFPDEISKNLTPEVRSLPFNGDREHDIELVVREVLLGPARHSHLRLFSREGLVNTVLVRGTVVYVDFSKRAFLPDTDVLYSPQKAFEVLKSTLKRNFGGVSDVVISVDGEPTGQFPLTKDEASI